MKEGALMASVTVQSPLSQCSSALRNCHSTVKSLSACNLGKSCCAWLPACLNTARPVR